MDQSIPTTCNLILKIKSLLRMMLSMAGSDLFFQHWTNHFGEIWSCTCFSMYWDIYTISARAIGLVILLSKSHVIFLGYFHPKKKLSRNEKYLIFVMTRVTDVSAKTATMRRPPCTCRKNEKNNRTFHSRSSDRCFGYNINTDVEQWCYFSHSISSFTRKLFIYSTVVPVIQ